MTRQSQKKLSKISISKNMFSVKCITEQVEQTIRSLFRLQIKAWPKVMMTISPTLIRRCLLVDIHWFYLMNFTPG